MRAAAVAYVKYNLASAAAAAQEHLHDAVLSSGCTKLKVVIAQAPQSRYRVPCQCTSMNAVIGMCMQAGHSNRQGRCSGMLSSCPSRCHVDVRSV
jgi:hypothetical protein